MSTKLGSPTPHPAGKGVKCVELWNFSREFFETYTSGGVKQGRFVILRFPLFCSVWGSQDTQMLGKTARKVSLSHPFLYAPNASKD